MESFLRFVKNLIPESIFRRIQPIYHFSLAFLAAFFYVFPSRRMIVVGVTGTKGKTTTASLIAQILNSSGHKTGLATTVSFRIGEKEWTNETKQTMLGRFQLQKLLARMAREGCEYAVIETSSEGILQFRHRFINYRIAVFTNLTPEHLERHGGFENYRQAKVKLFEKVARSENGIGVYNLDDPNAKYFLWPKVKRKYGYTSNEKMGIGDENLDEIFLISDIDLSPEKSTFKLNGEQYEMPLLGEFNVYNAAAAIIAALSQRIPAAQIKKALEAALPPPGRLEILKSRAGFRVVIDYAHEPASLEAVYRTIRKTHNPKHLICLLGAQGGGRDKWKRPEMGRIAANYCDKIILTNEDPYDEPPEDIINDIASDVSQRNLYKILDRRAAIKKALSLAKKGDVIILTGKGGEVSMCAAGGKKIPWNERAIVEEALGNL